MVPLLPELGAGEWAPPRGKKEEKEELGGVPAPTG